MIYDTTPDIWWDSPNTLFGNSEGRHPMVGCKLNNLIINFFNTSLYYLHK